MTLLVMKMLIGARNSPATQAELESTSPYLPICFFPSNHGTHWGIIEIHWLILFLVQ